MEKRIHSCNGPLKLGRMSVLSLLVLWFCTYAFIGHYDDLHMGWPTFNVLICKLPLHMNTEFGVEHIMYESGINV